MGKLIKTSSNPLNGNTRIKIGAHCVYFIDVEVCKCALKLKSLCRNLGK